MVLKINRELFVIYEMLEFEKLRVEPKICKLGITHKWEGNFIIAKIYLPAQLHPFTNFAHPAQQARYLNKGHLDTT